MKNVWRKNTSGKRMLGMLLAILMIFESVSVNATTLAENEDVKKVEESSVEEAAMETASEVEDTSVVISNDETGIPDENLYNAILSTADSDGDGVLTVAEAESITMLLASSAGITNIQGIEYCKNLEILYLGRNFNISDISPLKDLLNLEKLNLGDNNISDISPLANLTNLSSLELYTNNISDISILANLTDLDQLWISHNNISNIDALKNIQYLQTLDLASNSVSDISPLENMQALSWLNLAGNCITDISPLEAQTGILELELASNNITDISVLANLTNLEKLELSNNEIINISSLSSLINLRKLYLQSNAISDISALENLTNITYLNLGANQISDVTALTALTNLIELYLNNNQISDVSALSGLINLNTLDLSYNNISDVSDVEALTNIQYLYLTGNPCNEVTDTEDTSAVILNDETGIPDEVLYNAILAAADNNEDGVLTEKEAAALTDLEAEGTTTITISNLKGIEKCTNLSSLILNNNKITDLSPLENLTKLTELEMYGNDITDISSLAGLTNLIHLHLFSNDISNIDALENMTSLERLYLSFNYKISDVSALANIGPSLKMLYMDYNEVSDVSPLRNLTGLNELTLSYNNIVDVSPLAVLTNLRRLDLSMNQIEDASPLDNLTSLSVLNIAGNPCSVDTSTVIPNDVTGIPDENLYKTLLIYADVDNNDAITVKELESITTLELDAWSGSSYIKNIENIKGLEYCTNLTILKLLGTKVIDITPLANLTKLESLNLEQNAISDISPLKNLTNLTSLVLGYNHISDIDDLINLTKLEVLSLVNNQISDIGVLKNLSNLTRLDLGYNCIDDISALEGLDNLNRLQINNNIISEINVLENMSNITTLDISYNNINDISMVVNLTDLHVLNLMGLGLENIEVLSRVTSLESLNLSNNGIRDVNPLSGMTKLMTLELKNNKIEDVSPLASLTGLYILDLRNNFIMDPSPVENLPKLNNLNLEGNLYTGEPLSILVIQNGKERTVVDGDRCIMSIDDTDVEFTIKGYEEYSDLITDITVTPYIVGIHGSIGKVLEGENEYFTTCLIEPKNISTSLVKVEYKYNGEDYCTRFYVDVWEDSETVEFGYVDFDNEFVPFTEEKVTIELGQSLHLFTSMSPRVLSNIKVTSETEGVVSFSGEINEDFIYNESNHSAYISEDWLYVWPQSLGETKLTMSAEYQDITYTQTVTVVVSETTGLAVKSASASEEQFGVYTTTSGRISEFYLNSNGKLSLLALCDDNTAGENTFANKNNYSFEIIKVTDGVEEISTDFSIQFVTDSIFFIVPNVDSLSTADFTQKLRITSEDGRVEEIQIGYFAENTLYENYDSETNTLLDPVTSITLVEGMEKKVYFRVHSGGEEQVYSWSNSNVENLGCNMSSKVVATGEYNVIEATLIYNAGDIVAKAINAAIVDKYGTNLTPFFDISFLTTATKEISAVSQQQISDFVSATDSSMDIDSGIRLGDYEVALKTQEGGSKTVILLGYLGTEEELYLPEIFKVSVIVAEGTNYAMSADMHLKVIGCEDGVLNSEKGYYQSNVVHVPAGYTYFGSEASGWTNKASEKSTIYYKLDDADALDDLFVVQDGGLFVKFNEKYIWLEKGTVDVSIVIDGSITLYTNRLTGRTVLNFAGSENVTAYKCNDNYLIDKNGLEVPVKIEKDADNGTYYLYIDREKADEETIQQLESGIYYIKLVPVKKLVIDAFTEPQLYELAEILCEVSVIFDNEVPKVLAQEEIVFNTYFGSEAIVPLKITNNYETAITSVVISSGTGFTSKQDTDGTWLLCWDGITPIEENTEITLKYTVDGFVAKDKDIALQTIVISSVSEVPSAKLSVSALTFNIYPYDEQIVALTVENNNYKNTVMLDPEKDIVTTSVPNGVDIKEPNISFAYSEGKLTVDANANTVNGTYKFVITPSVGATGSLKSTSAILTINVKGTKPAFKLNTSSVTLDAAYPSVSTVAVKYLMDEGYELADLEIEEPNSNAKECIAVLWDANGTITFTVKKPGLSSAGTYKLTPTLKLASGETATLKEVKLTVKVTNASKVSLSSKSKSVSINPYVGEALVDAKLAVKGFVPQDSAEYVTYYEYVPTNELAKNAANIRLVFNEDGSIGITGCENYTDGKYTYNLVGIIEGTDGTVTYTKPLAFTVQLKTKALTIVPAQKSVTIHADYCETVVKNNMAYYKVEIPISVKESADMLLDTAITNAMASSGVSTAFNAAGDKLIIEFPVTLTKLNNVTITPEDDRFAAFKVSITVNAKEPQAAFAAKKVTMNRYTDVCVANTVVDTEGYTISDLKNIVIKKGKNVISADWFDTSVVNGTIEIGIPAVHDADIVNGDYTVSATPVVTIGGDEKELAACSFTLKVTQLTVKLSIGEKKASSQTINLFPTIGKVESEKFVVNAYSGNEALEIAEISIAKDKKLFTSGTVNEDKTVTFEALKDAETDVYKKGKNTYIVTAKVVKANGVVDTKELTLNRAFIVNIKDVPKSLTFAKTSLTLSPYVESKVVTSIKSNEFDALITSGDYYYQISAVEMDSKYKEAVEENGILAVSGSSDGKITVDSIGIPTNNTKYYYLVTVNLMQKDHADAVATYTVKLNVSVKNTLPKAILQMSSISLDNAFVKQGVTNNVILTTGTGLWTLDALSDANIIVKSGNKDITDAEYFNISFDGTKFTVSLNNKKADGTLITVPKGSYKILITPKISEKNGTMKDSLQALTMTVMVASSRPTVKYKSTKLTLKASGEVQTTTLTLSNAGKFDSMSVIECTNAAKGATEADVAGIHVELAADGTLSAYADSNVTAGNYTFTVNPVTEMDDNKILLDANKITVVVKK